MDTLEFWTDAFGAESGNLALRVLAYGGVYLAGGIAVKILPLLQKSTFSQAFADKGALSTLLANIPIAVVLNEDAPLLGSAHPRSQFSAAAASPNHRLLYFSKGAALLRPPLQSAQFHTRPSLFFHRQLIHFSQLREHPGPQSGDHDRADATKNDRRHSAKPLRGNSRLKLTEFVRCADKDHVHGIYGRAFLPSGVAT